MSKARLVVFLIGRFRIWGISRHPECVTAHQSMSPGSGLIRGSSGTIAGPTSVCPGSSLCPAPSQTGPMIRARSWISQVSWIQTPGDGW